jgi:hypothetical protein
VYYEHRADVPAGKIVYECPICLLYYERIQACAQCLNYICVGCESDLRRRECPFCRAPSLLLVQVVGEPAKAYFKKTTVLMDETIDPLPQ